jgi:hypothetical protein
MIVEKPTTHAQAYAEASERLKKKICRLLEWDEMQYAEYQYATGIAYLYWYLPCDDRGRNQLERSRLFWNWFKNLWKNDDFVFNSISGVGLIRLCERRIIYEELHCPRVLATEWKPNAVVLAEIKNKVA